jgi:hypothetical protein
VANPQDVEPVINCNAPISWKQLESLLQYRLDRARERNDLSGKPIAETEAIRGEIRCLKSLLDLSNEATRQQTALPPELS